MRTKTVQLLPPDSLARALLLAAQAVTGVMGGRSLADAPLTPLGEASATRASVQDLVYGTLRRYGQGDALVAALLSQPLTKTEVHALLLCALYRLETRPEIAHTVVDQAVEAAGQLAHGAFRGLVNGVLRNFLRRQAELRESLVGNVARRWHPDWWIARLRRAYPDDWEQILNAGNGLPPMSLRVNQRRQSRDEYRQLLANAGIEANPVGLLGLRLVQAQAIDALPGFADGCVSVQDAGAQRAAELLGVVAGQRVLDACAAPGGKTAHVLELSDVRLTAIDLDAGRARRINDNLSRLRLKADVRVADCRQPKEWWDGHAFDRILADVPCSASGVVRRHPDSKWLRREKDIAGFARTQRQILAALWPTLANGGQLLYATCSVFPEENGTQITAFLSTTPTARLISAEQLLPQQDHDGFYYALLQKTH